jgi:hypothetical protein
MDKKKILHVGIIIVIAIFSYLCYYFIKQNNINHKIHQQEIKQFEIKKQVDSLRILNNYLETLNKKDGTAIKQIEKNIIKSDSLIDTYDFLQLQKLLSK